MAFRNDIASFIKDTMEQRFSGTWHCVVGRSFGSRVSYELESFALFKLNQHTVLIFKWHLLRANAGNNDAVINCTNLSPASSDEKSSFGVESGHSHDHCIRVGQHKGYDYAHIDLGKEKLTHGELIYKNIIDQN
uniref:Dynein light chain n=1 Tax=Globodera rostochiensis TaxID=31243 RepID=A0A914H337_GLORO